MHQSKDNKSRKHSCTRIIEKISQFVGNFYIALLSYVITIELELVHVLQLNLFKTIKTLTDAIIQYINDILMIEFFEQYRLMPYTYCT
jgi:hypothetical protein